MFLATCRLLIRLGCRAPTQAIRISRRVATMVSSRVSCLRVAWSTFALLLLCGQHFSSCGTSSDFSPGYFCVFFNFFRTMSTKSGLRLSERPIKTCSCQVVVVLPPSAPQRDALHRCPEPHQVSKIGSLFVHRMIGVGSGSHLRGLRFR